MFKVLKGMITHVGHVKGDSDPVFNKLVARFNHVIESIPYSKVAPIKIFLSADFYKKNTFIIQSDNDLNYYDDASGELVRRIWARYWILFKRNRLNN